MATFSELRDSVYALTNRPDLVQETIIGLRKSLFKYHQADSWKQDLAIQIIDFSLEVPYEPNRWNIPLSDFSRHRRGKDLRIPPEINISDYPPNGNALFYPPYNQVPSSHTFKFLTVDNIFDAYNCEKPCYWFIAGQSLYIKASFEPTKLSYIYYQWPVFASTEAANNITSWIADQYPDAVVEEAAAAVFKAIGKDDEHQIYRALFAENIQLLRGTDVGES